MGLDGSLEVLSSKPSSHRGEAYEGLCGAQSQPAMGRGDRTKPDHPTLKPVLISSSLVSLFC